MAKQKMKMMDENCWCRGFPLGNQYKRATQRPAKIIGWNFMAGAQEAFGGKERLDSIELPRGIDLSPAVCMHRQYYKLAPAANSKHHKQNENGERRRPNRRS